MTPAPIPPVHMADRLRRLESRVAMLEDATDMAPRRLQWLPELSRDQRSSVLVVLAVVVCFTISSLITKGAD